MLQKEEKSRSESENENEESSVEDILSSEDKQEITEITYVKDSFIA